MSLVSIVIPCYNASRWVGESVESCLRQTHRPLEIVVIDDGSADGTIEVLQSYADRIILELGPHRGGNHARNRGIQRSTGEFVQFLDADDYLLPGKVADQVSFLEATAADVVYGDWRHQYHQVDGRVELGEIVISGAQEDVLGALLSQWWVAPGALLFRRRMIDEVGGWDESLTAAQDTDFFISVALAGAKVLYQGGCGAVYRRYGQVTVSTGNRIRWLENHIHVLDKAMKALSERGNLCPSYRLGLAHSYFVLARNYFDIDRRMYNQLMAKVLLLEPCFRPKQSFLYDCFRRCVGFEAADIAASWKRRLTS